MIYKVKILYLDGNANKMTKTVQKIMIDKRICLYISLQFIYQTKDVVDGFVRP